MLIAAALRENCFGFSHRKSRKRRCAERRAAPLIRVVDCSSIFRTQKITDRLFRDRNMHADMDSSAMISRERIRTQSKLAGWPIQRLGRATLRGAIARPNKIFLARQSLALPPQRN